MNSGMLDVTVVVVGYNDRESLPTCVAALAADPAATRIVVVDNASSDGTASILSDLEATDSRVGTEHNTSNLGYAGAVDDVLGSIETSYVAVINADCVPSPGWLAPQIAYLDANPDYAATCPTLTMAGSDMVNAAGQEIHITGLGFNRMLHHRVAEVASNPQEVSGIQGTAFVVRRQVLVTMGGWYAGGFLYHEDVELSWTLRLMGYRIAYIPTPPVEHNYSLTMSPEKLYLLERNRWEMLLANTRWATRLLISPLLLWTELMMWTYCASRGFSMLAAKKRSYRSIGRRRGVIAKRRAVIARLRRVPDRHVLRALHWNYTWDQLAFLGRRRSSRGRRGGREMPVR
jgi:GT2 family glycosyltransferase